ncbi:MAG: ammonia-forming cytochrome c nitrite reductase subunit c552, partial [Acidobacteria bacterium]|nr:ammonia-forming cytochrome c nitrite reductase subunit c552 [Acidobacteriota bacterium]
MKKKIQILFLMLLAAGVAAASLFGLQDDGKPRAEESSIPASSLSEQSVDPAEWGKFFPVQYEDHLRTSERTGTKYGGGGGDTPATDRLAENPRLKILFAGNVFSADYRERRGHAYMLSDQRETLRIKEPFRQSGGCLQCHSSNVAVYRNQGLADGAPGSPSDPLTGPNGYAQLLRGFEKVGKMPYEDATKLFTHPLSCIDCHDP